MIIYFCRKAALTLPSLLDLFIGFLTANKTPLVHVPPSSEDGQFEPVQFPLPTSIPQVLHCLPEFVYSADLAILLFVFDGFTKVQHYMNFVLCFFFQEKWHLEHLLRFIPVLEEDRTTCETLTSTPPWLRLSRRFFRHVFKLVCITSGTLAVFWGWHGLSVGMSCILPTLWFLAV